MFGCGNLLSSWKTLRLFSRYCFQEHFSHCVCLCCIDALHRCHVSLEMKVVGRFCSCPWNDAIGPIGAHAHQNLVTARVNPVLKREPWPERRQASHHGHFWWNWKRHDAIINTGRTWFLDSIHLDRPAFVWLHRADARAANFARSGAPLRPARTRGRIDTGFISSWQPFWQAHNTWPGS